jgi:hypothetical protein
MVSASLEFAGPAAEELWGWHDGTRKAPLECLIEGPAGTGKTHLILQFIRSYCEANDGVRVLMVRDQRSTMTDTVLPEWENDVLGHDHPAMVNGPTRAGRRSYLFSNGSEVVLGGFNNEGKLFSGQYHGLYFNEAFQTIERKWETLNRAIRAKGGPFRFMIADTNPRHAGHWLNQRAKQGKMMRLCTKLWHNPRFYRDGEWQEDGIEYYQRMVATQSGPNYENLVLGIWNNPTGRIWPEYRPETHHIYARVVQDTRGWSVVQDADHEGQPPIRTELRWFVLSIDIGTRSPGCLQAWGVTEDGVMYLVEEFYRTMWDHSDWVKRALSMVQRFHPLAMVSDHDQAFILSMNRALMDAGLNPICRNADKTLGKPGKEGKQARIAMVRTRFKQNRMFLLRGARLEPDPELVKSGGGTPTCFEEEIEGWSYIEYSIGEDANARAEEPDPTLPDHGCDAAMYADAFVWGKQVAAAPVDRSFAPGTYGRMLKHPERQKERGLWK